MTPIRQCELPQGSLLRKYQHEGAFADCYVTELARPVTHAEYVEAFYTTTLFKIERMLLAWLVSLPSSDLQAAQLASGTLTTFAAWKVEDRTANQLLMADFQGRTRSWLMVSPAEDGVPGSTRLYLGSAVVPAVKSGKRTLGLAFRLLLGFHKLYSRALLFATKSRLERPPPSERPIK